MKMVVLWGFALCSLVDIDRRFREADIQIMEAVSLSKTSANIYQTTWYNIPEDSYLLNKSEQVCGNYQVQKKQMFKNDTDG
jgi:hypothetical protein